jgi:hypothetical protein
VLRVLKFKDLSQTGKQGRIGHLGTFIPKTPPSGIPARLAVAELPVDWASGIDVSVML